MNNIFDNWHLGVTFGFRAKRGWYKTEEARRQARAIAESGADWVVLVATVFQEHTYSTRQFADFVGSPADDEIIEMVNYLHSLGLKVQLRPMLETLDGAGRLQIWFPEDDVDGTRIPGKTRSELTDWFASMEERAVHYAQIAEKAGCEIYCLDSELDRLVPYNSRWKKVIEAVRKVYNGALTSCHTTHLNLVNYEKILKNKNHWFYDLDFLSLSCYHMAANYEMTKEEMVTGFIPQVERFKNYAKEYGKPILFGEFGCNFDPQRQADYLSTVLELFSKEDWWYGLYWWKWDEQIDRPLSEKRYPISGRPAEKLFNCWGKADRSREKL